MTDTTTTATARQIGHYNDLANTLSARGELVDTPNWLTISKADASEMITDLQTLIDTPTGPAPSRSHLLDLSDAVIYGLDALEHNELPLPNGKGRYSEIEAARRAATTSAKCDDLIAHWRKVADDLDY